MLSQECDALRPAGLDGERIQPERLPAIVKPIEQSEMMAMEVEDVGYRGAVGQGQHDGPAQRGSEGTGLPGKKAEGIGFAHRNLEAKRVFQINPGR
jgi:hypothetical protein